MPRAIWSGAISFGLVNVPVKLFSATSPKTVRFNQLSSKTGARIRQKRVDASTGEEVPFEEIIKGFEIAPDRYVRIEPDELEKHHPKATHTIDVEQFAQLDEIDPIFYDSSYYVVPSAGGGKPYQLLLEAMQDEGKVAIARIVLRTRQQLCALRPTGAVLTLSTMLFGDEINSPDDLDGLDQLTDAKATDREIKMARQLIESLSADFDPATYKDDYREQVLALIERKAAGETIEPAPEVDEPAPVPDLMAALEASLAALSGTGASPKKAPAKKTPAKKSAAAKKPAGAKSPAKPAQAKRAPAKKPAPAKS